ncbi:MAG: flavodoxin [Acutalibacteraceae bacterium]|nr:flavodoxin [Acutalibacteraceae bacterium]
MKKILTVYFSHKGENYFPGGIKVIAKGNTEIAAEYIQKAIGGDLLEIETVKPYPNDYKTCCDVAKEELHTNTRPEIKTLPESISQYEAIFVCYPNWWGTAPMCIFTFLDQYDLTGKKIIPLCTNEGSGMGTSEQDLQKNYPNTVFAGGLSIHGHKVQNSETIIANWATKSV